MLKWFSGAALVLVCSVSFAQLQVQKDWIVTKTEWSEQDEIGFGDFVRSLAKTKCATVNDCLRSEGNPYRNSDPAGYAFWSDCADLPYFLRAYYAWKNQLPFSYVSDVGVYPATRKADDFGVMEEEPTDMEEEDWEWQRVPVRDWWGNETYEMRPVRKRLDRRYSPNGNFPTSRARMAPSSDGSRVNFVGITDNMQNTISSGMFRFRPGVKGNVDPDFYPIDINAKAVRPGAVVYSPNGHVSIVYEVTADGRILLFNAHPADRSKPGSGTPVSRTTFETRKEYIRSRPEQGSGLKQWRPFRLVNAKWRNDRYVGGSFVFAKDNELPNFSVVQFYGTNNTGDHTQAVFVIRGKKVSYETFIRQRLATALVDPLKDFERLLNDACELFKGRVSAVQAAVSAGVHEERHPSELPQNIFSADGVWEDQATASRDTRLRAIFSNLREDLIEQIAAIRAGESTVVRRANLRAELLESYARMEQSCKITYRNSANRPVTLGFEDLVNRLTAISFDPYHCPERRWGATSEKELATCRDDSSKTAWYHAEQIVRNYVNKDWKASGPIDITDLQQGRLGFGKPGKPDLNIKAFVQRLPETL